MAEKFDVAAALRDQRILFVGATGFIGKVALSMLLHRYPGIGKVYVLVRPGHGETSEDRFYKTVAASPPFGPLREAWGPGFDAFLREKTEPVDGDVSKPLLNFEEELLARLSPLGAILNCAGLVSFDPTLETGLRINTLGVRNVVDVARRTGAAVIHVSTCFVAGNRDGDIWEDEPVLGYFPRKGELRDEDFSLETEIADCERVIAQTKERADDHAHLSLFRDRAAQRLREERRDPDDERALRVATQRERKLWIAERLTELGMERAQHWGWPNTYTYTKSLGEQVCAAARDVRTCIVRPAIVESAVAYPFPGWNEGFTTTAPLAFVTIKGHRSYPSGEKTILDIIPVDYVASGLILATAATLAGENEPVYQLGSSDVNPLTMKRAVELLGLFKRRYFQEREEGYPWLNEVLARLEPVPVTRDRFNARSAPMWKSLADRLKDKLDEVRPRWGAPYVSALVDRAQGKLQRLSDIARQTDELFQLFMPFIHERVYVFRCDHLRALHARLTLPDRAALPWAPESLDWRHWWLDVHMPGLQKWVFPSLEEEFEAKPRVVYTYRDLLEMFDTTTKLHRSRTAMKLLPPLESGEEAKRYTYADLQELAGRVAGGLKLRGVGPGDRVMLLSENRPEWGITYFGILKAGAVAVPVEHGISFEEVVNLLQSSAAKVLVISDRQLERLSRAGHWLSTSLADAGAAAVVARFAELLGAEPIPVSALVREARASEMASLIFTSGTTGRPKGVMLSHRNFTSLLSRLSSIFDMDEHDGLLSVLPLHHTFEFTAGLLMPLMSGAQIQYLEEIGPESLADALRKGNVTTLVGVPALWQLLHRKLRTQIQEKGGPWATRVFEALLEQSRKLRDQGPIDINLGKLFFLPVHLRMGGKLRLLISGGSALAADTFKAFRGLGFNLYEGYGLTEAAPVLTVNRPGKKAFPGTVGEPLPGVEVRIAEPDASGVGEVVASGPNVMLGYYRDAGATAEVIHDGWLHTGDLGKFDEEKRLFIVGRKKDVIISPTGENVYPDELEETYLGPYVKELSIVGLPQEGVGEMVACLLVPNYDLDEPRGVVREKALLHVREVSAKLPVHKRIKVLHLWEKELPKTATRKVKRKLIVEELTRLERLRQRGAEAAERGGPAGTWVHELIAKLTGVARERVHSGATLAELNFDSLLYAELGAALESAGVHVPDGTDLSSVVTVADVERLAEKHRRGKKRPSTPAPTPAEEIRVPGWIAELGRRALDRLQRISYEKVLETKVTGRAYVPAAKNFIVAANHSSHLDMGLVKHALGDWGPRVAALAAKDYFFEDPVRKAYFESFTNLVPMDRFGSLRESLRLASELLRQGWVLLIFPEGTRSRTGAMADFKPSVGYLALQNQADVLPVFLEGTHQALPVGSAIPRKREIAAHIGPLITSEVLRRATVGLRPSEANRVAARLIEDAVRRLDPTGEALRNREAAAE
jgi:long-chain acyl-CoA synthetase